MRDIRKRESSRSARTAPRAGRAERAARRTLEESVGYELGRAFRRMSRAVSAAVRPHGLSAVQGTILQTLWTHGPLPIGELQALMAFSSSAFTGALDRMEQAGLVRRVPSPTDRRSSLVEPAKWPGARRLALVDALIAAEDGFLAGLTRAERAQLLALLRRIGGGNREDRSAGAG
jgi:DNA-binding MarR family transcriptional regulator